MKPHHRINLWRVIVAVFALYGAYCMIPDPTPCRFDISHLNSDVMGERYVIHGYGWSGYLVTDVPVYRSGACEIEVAWSREQGRQVKDLGGWKP